MTNRVHSIDALRGIAALGVSIFCHFHFLAGNIIVAHPELAPGGFIPGASWLYLRGDGLVDLFFVLSGFIFCHIYRPKPEPIAISPRAFFVYRFARLYPILLLTTLVAGAIMLMSQDWYGSTYGGVEVSWTEAVKHLLFLKQGVVHGSMNAPAWSISVEVTCYLLFYLIATRSERMFIPLCCLMVLVGVMALQDVVPFPMKDWWLPRGLVGFFAGCLLHRAKPLVDRIPTPVLAVGAVAGLYLSIAQPPVLHHMLTFGRLSLIGWPPVIALALRPWPAQVLAWKPFSLLGDLSYSVYLWHLPVAATILLAHGQVTFPPSQWLILMVGDAAAVLLVAYASFRWIETPARRYLRRFAGPKPPTDAGHAQTATAVT